MTPEQRRINRSLNRDKALEKSRAYYAQTREQRLEYQRRYIAENQAKVNEQRRIYMAKRRANDPDFRLGDALRTRLRMAMKGNAKIGSAVRDLGCSIPEFKLHIESQFTPGMSWENYGKWHLDHIKPLAQFDLTDRGQFLEAAHFSNYQPLWAADNIKKGAS